jgi:hypothetical protein
MSSFNDIESNLPIRLFSREHSHVDFGRDSHQ